MCHTLLRIFLMVINPHLENNSIDIINYEKIFKPTDSLIFFTNIWGKTLNSIRRRNVKIDSPSLNFFFTHNNFENRFTITPFFFTHNNFRYLLGFSYGRIYTILVLVKLNKHSSRNYSIKGEMIKLESIP